MQSNINSGYGQFFGQKAVGKVFVLASSSESNYGTLQSMFKPDSDGINRLHTTWASAIAATVAGRGDVILVSPNFTTAPTLAQLATMGTNGVVAEPLGSKQGNAYVAHRATAALPQTATGNLFTVTGMIKLLDIVGEVTTVIQAQANAVKLQAVPTVGSAVDISGTLDINAFAVGRVLNITGTLATAMASNANGVLVAQAASILIPAGAIALNTAASNTGAIKWTARYEPVYPGAMLIPD